MPKSKNRRKSRRPAPGTSRPAGPSGTGASGQADAASTIPGDAREKEPAARKKVGPVQFFRQVRDEGQKITWTTRSETMVSTVMVLIMVAIMSAFFLAVDQVLRWIVPLLLNINS